MTRIEGSPGNLNEELVRQALGKAEKKVLGDFIESLAASYCDGLRGVDFAVLPAGDFADFLNRHRGKPERIDLRVIPGAPTGSARRELFVSRLEQYVKEHLDEASLSYTQKSGMRWHTVQQSHAEESTGGLIKVESDGAHSICFEVDKDSVLRRRPIGIVIGNIRDRALDDHLKWEKAYRQRSPMILLDSRSVRKRIKF